MSDYWTATESLDASHTSRESQFNHNYQHYREGHFKDSQNFKKSYKIEFWCYENSEPGFGQISGIQNWRKIMKIIQLWENTLKWVWKFLTCPFPIILRHFKDKGPFCFDNCCFRIKYQINSWQAGFDIQMFQNHVLRAANGFHLVTNNWLIKN